MCVSLGLVNGGTLLLVLGPKQPAQTVLRDDPFVVREPL